MSRYYLLRKNHEIISGPHNLSEIASLHKNGQCNSEDEITGNIGPWVYIKQRVVLQQRYPELINVFYANERRENLVSSYDKFESKSPYATRNILVVGCCIALISLAAVVYLNRRHNDNVLGTVKRLYYQDQDYSQAMELLEKNVGLIGKMSTTPRGLPIVRTFAFWSDIRLSSAVMTVVRDPVAIKTPNDCSQGSWERIWKNSINSWDKFLVKQKLLASHWSRLLSWDPFHIREKSASGWSYPRSYEHGCFLSASKAFVAMILPGNDLASIIRERIMWQSKAITSAAESHKVVIPGPKANPLLIWNCMEQSLDLKTLNICRRHLKNYPPTPLVAYTQEKYIWNKLRIVTWLLKNNSISTSKSTSSPPSSNVDSYNSINYQDAIEYLISVNNSKK